MDKGIPSRGRPPQPEVPYRLAVVASLLAEVFPGVAGIRGAQQAFVVPGESCIQRLGQLSIVLTGGGRMVVGVVAKAYVGTGREHLDRGGEVQVLGLAQEADGVAPGLAAKAVVEAEFPIDGERGCPLPVERAQPHQTGTHPPQRHAFADEGDEVRLRPDPLDVLGNDPHNLRLRGLAGPGYEGGRPTRCRRAVTASTRRSSGTRSCVVESRSRTVTALSSSESKSIVTHRGVPISSWRRYRRPMALVTS